ncbi:Hypothetical transmembrane protein [Flavobacterium indicum GPTSA100-9 = DSM 17447]|uniref:Hypothetical transmembrane protein n=1 Tax=Flavobacterium indicum (strain DSM 17447 / CIP 109464 / GPTSA100-9) TaxID=1094466 RepID=H8XNQ9_FLAIG|nr:hypothetical protein [Flavobacterium indicum]CCG52176.1 Hypothetical transmembrane protein [Flavobacterium indicum GPTSA100-9 = DSM 17447]
MKTYIHKILVFLLIVSFLLIQIGYNSAPSNSIFSAFVVLIKEGVKNSFGFDNFNLKTNYSYYLVEFLLACVVLIIATIRSNTKLMIIALIIFVFMWFMWFKMLQSIINSNLYLVTSIPFLIIITALGLKLLMTKKVSF